MAVHENGSPDDVEALELAIALSQRSNHPVSRALTALDGLLDQGEGSVSKRITEFRAVPGMLHCGALGAALHRLPEAHMAVASAFVPIDGFV